MGTSKTLSAFYMVFAVVLLAKGQAFLNPMPSVDAWSSLASWNTDTSSTINLVLTQHRYGQALLYILFDPIGFRTIEVASVSVFIALLITTGSALLAARVISPSSASPYTLAIGAAMIGIHPNFAEIFTFSDVALDVAIAIALAITSVWLALKPATGWKIMAAFMFAFAASIYQISVNFAAVLLAMRAAKDAAEGNPIRPLLYAGATLVGGLMVYALAIVVGTFVLDIQGNQRGTILRADQIGGRPLDLLIGLRTAFLPFWAPTAVSLTAMLVVGLGIVTIVLRAGATAPILASFGFAALALFSVIGVAGIGEILWLVPRVLAAAGVFVAAWSIIGLEASNRVIRLGTLTACIITLLGYVSLNAQVFFDHKRVVQWDAAFANRIVMRFEMMSEFPRMETVVIIGGPGGSRLAVPTQVGDLNISATIPIWSKAPLIEQATGVRLRKPTDDDQAIASEYCRLAPVWPSVNSTSIINGAGIVCLDRS